VRILESYDRFEINPRTGRRKGYRDKVAKRPPKPKRPRPSPIGIEATRLPDDPRVPPRSASAADARHAPIRQLVRRIRRDMNAAVPDVDPQGPGVDAAVLVVLRDPGRLGALATNYLSVRNPDRTAANQRRLLAAADLPLEVCLFWNAVPWDLGGRNPNSSDLQAGASYIAELVGLMVQSPIVVACGDAAHKVCARANLDAIEICHPSDRGLHGGGINREPAHLAGLKEAARRSKNRQRVSRAGER
jgi:hypothetical protein